MATAKTIKPVATPATTEPTQSDRLLKLMADQERLAQLRREEKAIAERVKAAKADGAGRLGSIIARQRATLPIWDRRSCSNRVYRRVEAGQRIEEAIADVLKQLGDAAKEDVENKQAGRPSLGLDAPVKPTAD